MNLTQIPADEFLLELVAKGALLMTIAFAITFTIQKASAALRHAVWSLAFVGLLLLPLCSALLPTWDVSVPRLVSATQETHVASLALAESAPAAASAESRAPLDDKTPAAVVGPIRSDAEVPTVTWAGIALLVWAAGATGMLIRLALVLGKLSLLRRLSRPVASQRWTERAGELSKILGITRPVLLLQHEEIVVPMTYGVRRPVILLPNHASGWSDDEVRVTLLHELLHVKRYDHFVHVLALSARALHWFNPLTWAAAKRLVIERERACDDGVLSMGVPSTSYADHLLGIARDVLSGREAPSAALAMARPSELRTRIVAILDPAQPRRTPTRIRKLGMTTCALLLVGSLAAMRPGQADLPAAASHSTVFGGASSDFGESDMWSIYGASDDSASEGSDSAKNGSAASNDDGSDPDAQVNSAGETEAVSTTDVTIDHPQKEFNSATRNTVVARALIGPRDQRADTTDLEAQRRALHAISELPRDRSVSLLTEVAETHRNPKLRAEAVFWLGQVGDDSVADLLERFARNDAEQDVQKKAIFALAELDDRRGVPRLMDLARTHSNNELRADAVFWLGQAGGPDVAEALETFARSDASADVQKKAIFALAELDDQVGVPHLIDLARTHSDPTVRGDAIFWLGETGDPRAADVLMDIVNGN